MSSIRVAPFGEARFVMPSAGTFAVFSKGTFKVSKIPVLANQPPLERTLISSALTYTPTNGFVTYTAEAGATIIIRTDGQEALYDYGGFGKIIDMQPYQIQVSPSAVNTTTTLTPFNISNGILTSTTASAVSATLPTGEDLDAWISTMRPNESFDWSVINTGPDSFTVVANTGHTIVGVAVVPTLTSCMFRTRKVDVSSYITYRLTI